MTEEPDPEPSPRPPRRRWYSYGHPISTRMQWVVWWIVLAGVLLLLILALTTSERPRWTTIIFGTIFIIGYPFLIRRMSRQRAKPTER